MRVPLLDLKAQYAAIKSEIDQAISNVMESQQFILGPWVQDCEAAVARYSQCSFGIGVSSGTDALLVCLMAEGIGWGDEVITTPYTFFATAGAIARTGARPVFVDIDPITYNIDPSQIRTKITPRTRAIIPVHLYGQMAEMDAVMDLAETHRLIVIEDAAQAIGAEFNNRRAGSLGHYGCFSFFPSKNLGGGGDGGLVVTNDPARAEKLRCLRTHGSNSKYQHGMIGGNFRLDALQAAIVVTKLPHLDEWAKARQRNARQYGALFRESGIDISDTSHLRLPSCGSRPSVGLFGGQGANERPVLFLPKVVTNNHVFNQYVIRVSSRDRLRIALGEKGIDTEVYYPVPMHLQRCFSSLGYGVGSFPESEGAAKESLALPVFPELSEGQARYVVECIRDFFLS